MAAAADLRVEPEVGLSEGSVSAAWDAVEAGADGAAVDKDRENEPKNN